MKKVFLSTLIAVLAIGTSAFTTANRFAKVYYQHADGLYYDSIIPGTTCEIDSSYSPCDVEYDTNQSIPNGTPFSSLPSGFAPIEGDGLYN